MIQIFKNKNNIIGITRGVPRFVDESVNVGNEDYLLVITNIVSLESFSLVPENVSTDNCSGRTIIDINIPDIEKGEYIFKFYDFKKDTKYINIANVKDYESN